MTSPAEPGSVPGSGEPSPQQPGEAGLPPAACPGGDSDAEPAGDGPDRPADDGYLPL